MSLRSCCCRTDLEKAIAAHGGSGAVAEALGWPLAKARRRPRGWWDNIDNVRAEVDAFVELSGSQPGA